MSAYLDQLPEEVRVMPTKPVLIDLFCGAGGATRGYQRAGFHVIGVDLSPMPNYCGDEFIQGDAMVLLKAWASCGLSERPQVIHASPPCQDHSITAQLHPRNVHGTGWMLGETISLLRRIGLQEADRGHDIAWVVENVERARISMPDALKLCGTEFGCEYVCRNGRTMDLRRHRLFLSNVPLMGAGGCQHRHQPASIVGHFPSSKLQSGFSRDDAKALMGIDWMTAQELTQAIPPAYTEFIGGQVLSWLERGSND